LKAQVLAAQALVWSETLERNMLIGYARVSTDAQHCTGQIAALQQAGAREIFTEKVSGAVTDRKRLRQALAALEPGDCLVVTKLDRLARSMSEKSGRSRPPFRDDLAHRSEMMSPTTIG